MAELTPKKILDALASLKLTIVALGFLMVLVILCTLAQVRLGTFGAVEVYMRSVFVMADLGGLRLPVFPGGALAGGILLVNLTAALYQKFRFTWSKAGMWLAHGGLVLLVAGEFVSGSMQVETNMSVEVGQTAFHLESLRQFELNVRDTTDPRYDDFWGVPESRLKEGATVDLPGSPVKLVVKAYHRNAQLSQGGSVPGVTAGLGAQLSLQPLVPVSHEKEVDSPAAVVEAIADGKSYGTWLVSSLLGMPQSFTHEGHTYRLGMGPQRTYLPYSLTLKEFRHDLYPGTNIPKNFSSLVRLRDPQNGQDRDVLIYMNQPLRYEGRTFYQASFGKNDTLSIFQVVENPGWLLPYISTVLVSLGLLIHFGISLRRATAPAKEA